MIKILTYFVFLCRNCLFIRAGSNNHNNNNSYRQNQSSHPYSRTLLIIFVFCQTDSSALIYVLPFFVSFSSWLKRKKIMRYRKQAASKLFRASCFQWTVEAFTVNRFFLLTLIFSLPPVNVSEHLQAKSIYSIACHSAMKTDKTLSFCVQINHVYALND